jgi:hypothetical protein
MSPMSFMIAPTPLKAGSRSGTSSVGLHADETHNTNNTVSILSEHTVEDPSQNILRTDQSTASAVEARQVGTVGGKGGILLAK